MIRRFFAGVRGAFFKKKSAPQVNSFHNKIHEKVAGGKFFDTLTPLNFSREFFHDLSSLSKDFFSVSSSA